MGEKFRVGIVINDIGGDFNIYISNISDGQRHVLEPTELIFSRAEEGMEVRPGIRCSWEYGIPLLRALRDAINRFDDEMGGVLG